MYSEFLQYRKIDVPPGHGCQVQYLSGSFTQLSGAQLNSILDAAWDVPGALLLSLPVTVFIHNVSGLDERFEQFLDEKGIALRNTVHGIQPIALGQGKYLEHRATY